jgi:hypothetical protein
MAKNSTQKPGENAYLDEIAKLATTPEASEFVRLLSEWFDAVDITLIMRAADKATLLQN